MVHICGRRYAQRAGETTEIRVYSNQREVELLVNGQCVEKQENNKVFIFTIALQPGFNCICAKAGNTEDSITLEKVDEEPSVYVLPEINERAEGVANWFKLTGNLDLQEPMTFPSGKYSVRDKIEEIAQSPEALKITAAAMKLATGFEVSPGAGIWDFIKSMTPEAMMQMSVDTLLEGFLESLNAQLICIDKRNL